MKVLGEFLTQHVGHSQAQVDATIKAMKLAIASFKWLFWAKEAPLELALKLVEEWVEAISSAKLIITVMTPTQENNVEEVKASVGRAILGLPEQVEWRKVLAQLGWKSTYTTILKTKLLLIGSLWRAEGDDLLDSVAKLRAAQVEVGVGN